ncbi:hypothetical protein ACOMHN_056672 [Nucella lapillus]
MRLQANGALFLLLVTLCCQAGGQPCQICDPKVGGGSCVPMSPPEGVPIDGAVCTNIETSHKDYHDKLCKSYPPPNGYRYVCTDPGSSNSFSCSSSCGPPLEDVGKGLNLDMLRGGGLLANFNSSADKSRGITNFGRFGTLSSLNNNFNNKNNNNNNNNNVNLFRNNNRNPSFNLLNTRSGRTLGNGNFRNDVLTQTRPVAPISGGAAPTRPGHRPQNPQPIGSNSPLNPSPSGSPRDLLQLTPPLLPGQGPSSPPSNDQPPPIGTLVLDNEVYNSPLPGHSAQGPNQQPPSLPKNRRLSFGDQVKENEPKVGEGENSPLTAPRVDDYADGSQAYVSGPVTGSSPKEDGKTPAGPYNKEDPQTLPDSGRLPTYGNTSEVQHPPASGSSPSVEDDAHALLAKESNNNNNEHPEEDPHRHNNPEILISETADYLDRSDRNKPRDDVMEKHDKSAGTAFKGENPAEPPYGLHVNGSTYPTYLGSDEAHPVNQSPQGHKSPTEFPAKSPQGLHTSEGTYTGDVRRSDEAHSTIQSPQDPQQSLPNAGPYPDLPPPPLPPPPPQTYLAADRSLGADSPSRSLQDSNTGHNEAEEYYPRTSSPDLRASALNTEDQAAPGVSHDQPPPSPDGGAASDPKAYSANNPEDPLYSDSRPPESYLDLGSESAEDKGRESDGYADQPSLPPADLRGKPNPIKLIESSPQPGSASVDFSGAEGYIDKAGQVPRDSLPRVEEKTEEEEEEEETEPEKGTPSRKDYNPDPYTYPSTQPTASPSDGNNIQDAYSSNNINNDNSPSYSNNNNNDNRHSDNNINNDNSLSYNNNNNNNRQSDNNNNDNSHSYNNNNNNGNRHSYKNTDDNGDSSINNNNLKSETSPQNSPKKNDEYSYNQNDNNINKKNDQDDNNNNNNNNKNLPPESFKNPFKNPSSPYRKRADHFESNPAFVGTSLFSEGFLDGPSERFHPGALGPRSQEPDAVDIGGNQIFPGFQEFEKTGASEVLEMGDRPPNNNEQRNLFSLFLPKPTINQPASRGTPSPTQTLSFRGLNPSGNPSQNPDGSGFQAFSGGSARNGQNSAGAVLEFNTPAAAKTSSTFHPTPRANNPPPSPRLTLPHPRARQPPPPPSPTPYPPYTNQGKVGDGGGGFDGRVGGATSHGNTAGLSGSSGFDSRQGFDFGSGNTGSKVSSTSSSSSGGQRGQAGSFARAGVRPGGFVDDEGFDDKPSFDNKHLSDDLFKDARSVSSDSDTEQPSASPPDDAPHS